MSGEFERHYLNKEIEVDILDPVRDVEAEFPVQPVRLSPGDSFAFACGPDKACWNTCCHGADITLTPADILRLTGRLEMTAEAFLLHYTVPAIWDKADLPVAKLKMTGEDGKGPCPFMAEEGCTVYADRPATCRYYPLGLASVKMKGDTGQHDFHFLVRESHCQGHADGREQSVEAFREEQGVSEYDAINRGWLDIMMKMASWKAVGGPFGQDLKPETRKMFFMVSTDVEKLRRFVFETKFLDTYEIDPESVETLKTDDVALLKLGFDWMKHVLFNDPTITMKERVLQDAIVQARRKMGVA